MNNTNRNPTADARRAPMRVIKDTPETEPRRTESAPANTFDNEEAELERAAEELATKRAKLEEQRRAAQEAEYERKLEEYNNYREDAANFRATAAKETDEPSKRTYLRWSLEADRKALELALELGLEIPKELEPQPEPDTAPASVPGTGRAWKFFQFALLALVLYASYNLFLSTGASLTAANQHLAPENQTQPYDATSIQKFYLEKFVEFFDLPLALIKLLIFAPAVLIYVVPFGRNRKSLFNEFHNDLTPFQRCVLTVVFISLFLLHSALSHLVKP